MIYFKIFRKIKKREKENEVVRTIMKNLDSC